MMVLQTLLEITIYSAVLFGVIWLFRRTLKKHLSAAMLYAVWFLLIARLLMPVTISSGVSLFVIPAEETQAAQTENVDVAELLGGLDNTIVSHNASQAVEDAAPSLPDTAAQTDTVSETQPLAPAAAVRFNVSWETVLIAVWLLGMAAMLMQILIAQMRLRRRLLRAQTVPEEWRAMADTLMQQLGLRRNVRVVIIAGFPSPALVAGLRPVVVLPEEMAGKGDAAVRFALLHELTHIRRGDHIVSLLLLILRAVHWFNPIVWLTARQMRLDMETACDSQLARSMDTAEKKQYAGTMLSMYADQQVRYVLGMALGQTKKTAERRLRGMFIRGKTSRKGRAAAWLMACVMLVACFTTACQPTPETPVVVGKDQDTMLDAAAQTPGAAQVVPVAEQVDAPGTYTAEISAADGKLKISADGAAVVLPDTDSMSIMRVTAADFTQVQMDGLISALFNGQTIYEVTYGPDTKDEIMQQIIYAQQRKASDEYSSEEDQQRLDEYIAWLREQYDAAPETSEDIVVESDGQLKKKELADSDGEHIAFYTGLNVTTNPEDYTQAASFGVENNNDMTAPIVDVRTDADGNVTGMSGRMLRRLAMLNYSNMGDAANFGQNPPTLVDEDTEIDDSGVLEKLTTTPAEAKALVEDMLVRAGIDNMAVVAMYLTDDENLGGVDGIVSDAAHYAYKLYLCRTVGGIPVAYINGASMTGGEQAMDEAIKNGEAVTAESIESAYGYGGEWNYETIDVMVDDTGIISLDWYSPLIIGDAVVKSATLLPFDDITAKFEKQMQIEWETRAQEDYFSQITFTVDHVSLEYQRIAEQNSIENGLLVPVWNFYATCTAIDPDGEDHGGAMMSGDGVYDWPLMTINAVDGSIIDIMQGY